MNVIVKNKNIKIASA